MRNPLEVLRTAQAGLDPHRIPTGILMNRVLLFTNPSRFAGQGDTAASYRGFEQQYWEYYHANLDTTQLLTLDSLRARSGRRVQQHELPLLMLSYRYNALSATSIQDGLITIDTVHATVTDGPNLSQSPYITRQLFSVALPLPAARGTVAVYVGREFWLGPDPAPASLDIDFGDGNGVQTVAMGSTVQVKMPAPAAMSGAPGHAPHTSAPTRGSSELTILASYQAPALEEGGERQSLSAATSLRALRLATDAPDVALGLKATNVWPGFTPSPNVVSAWDKHASAIAWIKYAAGNPVQPDGTRKLRRPLVFVEGIDFPAYRNASGAAGLNHFITTTAPLPLSDFTTGPAQEYGGYRNGTAGWNEMSDYNPAFPALEKFPDLRQQLQAPYGQTVGPNGQPFANGLPGGGYDIIYLDFSDGASLIQNNAMVLVELLQWIQLSANRDANTEETLVIGASMGGQVARFALAWMEQQQLCHNSKLYVSFDSPHRGANIPLGIQCMFDNLQGTWVGSGSAQEVVQTKLRREAAEQMLVAHFADEAIPLRNAWQAWQATPTSYPSLLRKVAVANGSGQAVFPPDMQAGMALLHTTLNPINGPAAQLVTGINKTYALGRGDRVIYTYTPRLVLGVGGVLGGLGGFFGGGIFGGLGGIAIGAYVASFVTQDIHSPAGLGNYDTAPGSSTRTAGNAQDVSDHLLVADYPDNTFMPTISTLDVRDAGSILNPDFSYDVKTQIPSNDRPNSTKYAFDAYFAAGSANEPHVEITNGQASNFPNTYNTSYYTDNSTWIENELLQSAHHLPALLTTTYNYGSPYRHLLPSVQVEYQGNLLINDGTVPVSGGAPNPATPPAAPPAGRFEVYTSTCNTVVQVKRGGQLQVGGDNAHPATLVFSNNSLLDVGKASVPRRKEPGILTIGEGSVLRIAAGGTLVVRQGATVTCYGQIEIDPGGYVCVEDPASIVLLGNGTYHVSQYALAGANPILGNLGTLPCAQQPLGVQFAMPLVYTNACYSAHGNPNYLQCTALAYGGAPPYTYTWSYRPNNSTSASYIQLPPSSSPVFGLCLTPYAGTSINFQVVVTSGSQTAQAAYYATSQYRTALYPNPADTYTDVTDDNGPSDAAASSAPALSQAASTSGGAGNEPPLQVTVYNWQGALVFSADNIATGSLHLATSTWPAGLYQVKIQHGQTVKTQQLSIQH
ncbi:MAG: T9SS type A sorting domain-containing protein [Janthinobacterium lividum]